MGKLFGLDQRLHGHETLRKIVYSDSAAATIKSRIHRFSDDQKNHLFVLLILWPLVMVGCHHHVAFDDIGYDTGVSQHDAGVVVVIDPYTLDRTVSIRSFMTGIAHSWDAKPSLMLKQVADVEFPQLFEHYEVADRYREPRKGKSRLTLKPPSALFFIQWLRRESENG